MTTIAARTHSYIVNVSWAWDNDEYIEIPTYEVRCPDCQEMATFDADDDTGMFDFMSNHHEANHA